MRGSVCGSRDALRNNTPSARINILAWATIDGVDYDEMDTISDSGRHEYNEKWVLVLAGCVRVD